MKFMAAKMMAAPLHAKKAMKGGSGIAVHLQASSTLVGGQRNAPALLPPRETRYPPNRRLVVPQGRSGWAHIISPPPGFKPRTVQPVASRNTAYATPAVYYEIVYILNDTFKHVVPHQVKQPTRKNSEVSHKIVRGTPSYKDSVWNTLAYRNGS
jgi:hypothetical protein